MEKKILIIEDDLYVRDLYGRTLKRSGYLVEMAIDGDEALEKTKDQTYDLILLDIMLPKVTGIDVLRTLRMPASKAYDTPIFLITNLGQEDIIKQAFAMGADGYFLKAQLSPQNVVDEIDAFFARLQKTGKSPKSSSS